MRLSEVQLGNARDEVVDVRYDPASNRYVPDGAPGSFLGRLAESLKPSDEGAKWTLVALTVGLGAFALYSAYGDYKASLPAERQPKPASRFRYADVRPLRGVEAAPRRKRRSRR